MLVELMLAVMMTPFGEKVTTENAWRNHPRPQLMHCGEGNVMNILNGDWDYAITSVTNTPGRPTEWQGKIRVPFAHFGAVDFRTMVFIGHDEVTDVPHEGGQNPFTLDITDYVKSGDNDLTVCVWDPTEDFVNSRGKQSFRPSGCFYTRVSGIWQTVWMERVPANYIKGYKVVTDIDHGTVKLDFDLVGTGPVEVKVDEVPQVKATGGAGQVVLQIPDAKLWSPEEPNLYHFTAKFGADMISGYFGMRKFEKRRDANGVLRFFLNNKPYYVMATLDHGWWPSCRRFRPS